MAKTGKRAAWASCLLWILASACARSTTAGDAVADAGPRIASSDSWGESWRGPCSDDVDAETLQSRVTVELEALEQRWLVIQAREGPSEVALHIQRDAPAAGP